MHRRPEAGPLSLAEQYNNMVESAALDEDDWPSLSKFKLDDEDWEMLIQETAVTPDNPAFEMVIDHAEEELKQESTAVNHKIFRHCVSSPNQLSANASFWMYLLDAVAEVQESDSFSLISGPASVMTASTGMMVSFRDAVLATPRRAAAEPARSQLPLTLQPTRQQRSRVQPRFVVVAPPLTANRRSLKSTENSKSSDPAVVDAHDEDKGCDLGSWGDCYTMEYYNRKAHGSASRCNGLKLRPDEVFYRGRFLVRKEIQQQVAKTQLAHPDIELQNFHRCLPNCVFLSSYPKLSTRRRQNVELTPVRKKNNAYGLHYFESQEERDAYWSEIIRGGKSHTSLKVPCPRMPRLWRQRKPIVRKSNQPHNLDES